MFALQDYTEFSKSAAFKKIRAIHQRNRTTDIQTQTQTQTQTHTHTHRHTNTQKLRELEYRIYMCVRVIHYSTMYYLVNFT